MSPCVAPNPAPNTPVWPTFPNAVFAPLIIGISFPNIPTDFTPDGSPAPTVNAPCATSPRTCEGFGAVLAICLAISVLPFSASLPATKAVPRVSPTSLPGNIEVTKSVAFCKKSFLGGSGSCIIGFWFFNSV